MSKDTSLLVIGEHNVGKTNYGVQLLGRLRANNSRLTLCGTPETIAPFESGLSALNNGKAPAHTPSAANLELVLPIAFKEDRVSLTWPDYGGEQVSEILRSRSLSEAWRDRIAKADGWILFLRLSTVSDPLDAIKRPVQKGKSHSSTKRTAVEQPDAKETVRPWNFNSKTIELLQMLLYAKHIGLHSRVKIPALVVALSCWDELETQAQEIPLTMLKNYLPLLYEFLITVWDDKHLSVFGVSAIGMAIDSNTVNEALRDEGPEQHGFVVKPDGSRTTDLSEPVVWLMEHIS